jgi:hypothetical protein
MGEWMYRSTYSAPVGGVGFTSRQLYTQGKSPGAHWIGCMLGPRVGFERYGEDSNSDPSAVQSVAIPTALSRF